MKSAKISAFDPTTHGERILQGLLLSVVGQSEHFPYPFGFVLTADCDLAQDKHNGYVTVLPVYQLENYLHRHELVAILRKTCEKLREELLNALEACNEVDETRLRAISVMSPNVFEEWILSASMPEVLKEVSLSEPIPKKVAESYCAYREAAVLARSESMTMEDWGRLVGSCGSERTKKEVRGRLKTALKEFEGRRNDAIVIPEIPAQDRPAWVVDLRLPITLGERFVMARRTEAAGSSFALIPHAVCSELLTNYVAQKFASLFSRIGLPSAFEGDTRASIELACGSYVK